MYYLNKYVESESSIFRRIWNIWNMEYFILHVTSSTNQELDLQICQELS